MKDLGVLKFKRCFTVILIILFSYSWYKIVKLNSILLRKMVAVVGGVACDCAILGAGKLAP